MNRDYFKKATSTELTLDVGCGQKKRGDIGVDYSRDSKADIIADACFLPFKDNSFDKVVCFCIFEHICNLLSFLVEVRRVLKIGGKLNLVTDNAQYYKWSVQGLGIGGIQHEMIYQDHHAIFYPVNVKRLFHKAGFKILSIRYIESLSPNKSMMHFFVKFLVGLKIFRRESLFPRFEVIGIKT